MILRDVQSKTITESIELKRLVSEQLLQSCGLWFAILSRPVPNTRVEHIASNLPRLDNARSTDCFPSEESERSSASTCNWRFDVFQLLLAAADDGEPRRLWLLEEVLTDHEADALKRLLMMVFLSKNEGLVMYLRKLSYHDDDL